MTWTPEKIEQIPEPYRDLMLALKPVIDSRRDDVVLKNYAIPSGHLIGMLIDRHGYEFDTAKRAIENLKREGLVQDDAHGFFTPTPRGEELIAAIVDSESQYAFSLPPFPHFEE